MAVPRPPPAAARARVRTRRCGRAGSGGSAGVRKPGVLIFEKFGFEWRDSNGREDVRAAPGPRAGRLGSARLGFCARQSNRRARYAI
jgi:hypothetical protein